MGGGGGRGGGAADDADADDAPSDDDDDDEGNGTTNSDIGNVASENENVAPFSMLAKKDCVPSVVGEGVQVSKCATDVCVCAAAAQIEISQSRNGFHMHDDV